MNFSYWEKQFLLQRADLVIIGSGISGLSTAYHAAKKHPNWRIVVLEQFVYGSAASTRNAGFACFGSAGELVDDLKNGTPKEEVLQTLESRLKGLRLLRKTIGDSALDYNPCGGTEIFTSDQSEEFEEITSRLGELNSDIRQITSDLETFKLTLPPSSLNGFDHAIQNSLEGKLNPGFMMKAWEQKCKELDVVLMFGVKAELLEDHSGVSINNHIIKAGQIAICTNGLSESLNLNLNLKPARNLVLLTKPLPHLDLPSTYHHIQGYMYFRKIHDRLLIGGGRHKFINEETDSKFMINKPLRDYLEGYLKKHMGIKQNQIEMEWTGIMGVGGSKKPLIKRINKHLVCGVKLGGMGVAIGSLVGKDVADLL